MTLRNPLRNWKSSSVSSELQLGILLSLQLVIATSCGFSAKSKIEGAELARRAPARASQQNPSANSGNGSQGSQNTNPAAEQHHAAQPPGTDISNSEVNKQNANLTVGVRKITRQEYANSVFDLLGVDVDEKSLPVDVKFEHLSNIAALASVSYNDIQTYLNVGAEVASKAVAKFGSDFPCKVSELNTQCSKKWLESFLPKAFRRAVAEGELAPFIQIAEPRMAGESGEARAERMVNAVLVSPSFLYKTEMGGLQKAARVADELAPSEIAARMSALLWQSIPDTELMTAANNGLLKTKEGRLSQLDRMFKDPRARRGLRTLVLEWLDATNDPFPTKSPALLAQYGIQNGTAFKGETESFIDDVVFGSKPNLVNLLSADNSFLNNLVGRVYGISKTKPDYEKTTLPLESRRGILTQPWILASHSKEAGASPYVLGKFIRESVLCENIPPPPAGVNTTVPASAGTSPDSLSLRASLEARTQGEPCATCHAKFGPVGFAFLPFDSVGTFRANDGANKPFDTAGALNFEALSESPAFVNVSELANILANHEKVAACFARHVYRWTYGRTDNPTDKLVVDALKQKSVATKGDFRALLEEVVGSEDFVKTKMKMETAK